MMRETMDCAGVETALTDYLDGALEPARREALERHLAGCDACASLEADLRQLTRDAAALPPLEPARDLWPAIAARIEAPVVTLDAARSGSGRATAPASRRWERRLRMGLAAAGLVAVTAGVTYWATASRLRGTQAAPPSPVASAPAPSAPPEQPSAERQVASATPAPTSAAPDGRAGTSRAAQRPMPSSRPAVATLASNRRGVPVAQTYDEEIQRLHAIVEQRRGQLDTATVNTIERNLRVIDNAIRDSRKALAADPASHFLNDQLNHALDQKVQLLRTAAMLPANT